MEIDTVAPTPCWIVSARYDLLWFFGGLVGALLVAVGVLGGLLPVVLVFWGWLLCVDGPHLFSTLARTFFDREEWRRRRMLLLLSLLTYALGPLALVANLLTGSRGPFLAFLGLATFYGYLHVVRQHWGFLALYRAVNREPWRPLDLRVDKLCLYVGCWAPYVYFLLRVPVGRQLLELPPQPAPWEQALGLAALVAFAVAAVVGVGWNLTRRTGVNLPKLAYLSGVLAVTGLTYLWAAHYEPVYPHPRTPDQALLMLSVMIALAHGVQYVGLLLVYNRHRYGGGDPRFGLAARLNRTPLRFGLGCLAFVGLVYVGLNGATGTFPGLALFRGARLGPFEVNQLALGCYWGLALQHYVLDQYIWRIRGDDQLRADLGLGTAAGEVAPEGGAREHHRVA